MFDQDTDDTRKAGLWIVFGVVAIVVASVLSFATVRTLSRGGADAATAAQPALGEPVLRLYFELGVATLPADAQASLDRVAEQVRSGSGAVVISGFHDASGDPARNAELAKQRALAVHHALEANGVSPDRLELSKPALTMGGTDPKEARRVEIHLR